MDKHLITAFEKLQKREHLLRVARDQMGLGRISREVFRQREAEILTKYSLTESEQRAYDIHLTMMSRKRRK
ncbi:hypothetical protein FE783_12525 [Paenibacillus mesophilus]|uniref:hypothetical protein n=1 Tax=Paenibacillus mesophilus TaxID=2582849 RepID=UPI00110E7A7E|nr:hypothetical protein [Paenibacillus mesophilus]TMV49334.1 hypothetical protein FE783_12525 [Paenibacillus mesophilus]